MKPARDASLDMFKGLCMALVMLVHVVGRHLPAGFSTWANSFKLVGFFVVSGYLLSLRDPMSGPAGVGEALRRRCATVLVPYAFFSALVLLVMPAVQTTNLVSATTYFNCIAAKTVTLCGQSTLWFLPVLFLAEALLLLVLAGERRLAGGGCPVRFRWPLLVAVGLALVASIQLSPLARPYVAMPPNSRIVGDLVLPWLKMLPACAALAVGYLLYGPAGRFCGGSRMRTLALGTSLLLAGWGTSRFLGNPDWNNNAYGGNVLLFLLSGSLSSFGFLLLFRMVPARAGAVLGFFGVNSLVLMATHLPLPFLRWARGLMSWLLGVSGVGTDFATQHPLASGLLVFLLLVLLELPVVFLFNHTPLRVLIGRRPGNAVRPSAEAR